MMGMQAFERLSMDNIIHRSCAWRAVACCVSMSLWAGVVNANQTGLLYEPAQSIITPNAINNRVQDDIKQPNTNGIRAKMTKVNTGFVDEADAKIQGDFYGVMQNNPFGLSDEQITMLSQHTLWQRLLLMDKHGVSAIKDERFFIAKSGRIDAKAELMALLDGMARQDDELVCRFVARVHFVNQQLNRLGIDGRVGDDECVDFQRWLSDVSGDEMGLVFASEHAQKLSSAFAHVFIKVARQHSNHATAVNYTVNANQAGPSSVLDPITGQAPAIMQIMPYAQKADEYRHDGRDLWHYQLNLDPKDIRQIMRHLWEIKDLQRAYYFTHDNCATEILRLLDVVDERHHYRQSAGSIVIPIEIVRQLDEQGVIKSSHHLPASPHRQARDHDHAINPKNNQGVRRADVAISHASGVNRYHLGVRGAYRDALDRPTGVRAFHDLQVMSAQFMLDKKGLKIDHATLIRTRHFDDERRGTPWVKAGGFGLGLKQVDEVSDARSHLVLDARFEKGVGAYLGTQSPDGVCHALGVLATQIGQINQGYRAGVGVQVGCMYHANPTLRMKAELSVPYWYHADDAERSGYWQPKASIGIQKDVANDNAIRVQMDAWRKSNQAKGKFDGVLKLSYLTYF